jgi:hypothetical protein
MAHMRERFLPVLEAYGVDLVLTGHSHSYERSLLIDGHYGLSSSYSPALHALDTGDGDPDGDGPYEKPVLGPSAGTGSVYSVVGSSSQISGGTLNHPVMEVSLNVLGSMVIDVAGRQLDATFTGVAGSALDHFRIVKGPLLADQDADGVDDDSDNCRALANGDQADQNADGYGDLCDADLNGDEVVGGPDFTQFRAAFGTSQGDPGYDPAADFTGDGAVGGADFTVLRTQFGGVPGPSGLSCAGVSPCP